MNTQVLFAGKNFRAEIKGFIKESNTQRHKVRPGMDTEKHWLKQTSKLNFFALSECSCNAHIHLKQQVIGAEPLQGIKTEFVYQFCLSLNTDGIGLPTTANLEGTDLGHRGMSHCTEFLLGAVIK